MILVAEMCIDWIKHAFVVKFNESRQYGAFIHLLCSDASRGWAAEDGLLAKVKASKLTVEQLIEQEEQQLEEEEEAAASRRGGRERRRDGDAAGGGAGQICKHGREHPRAASCRGPRLSPTCPLPAPCATPAASAAGAPLVAAPTGRWRRARDPSDFSSLPASRWDGAAASALLCDSRGGA